MGPSLSFEEFREHLSQGHERDTSTDGHHDGLFHVLVAILHLEIDVECAYQTYDCRDGVHKVFYVILVTLDGDNGISEPGT